MSGWFYCGLAVLGAVVVVIVLGGCRRTASNTYTSAKVIVYDPPAQMRVEKVVNDAVVIEQIIGFLSGLGARRHSNIAGRWMPEVEIRLHGADGSVQRVEVGARFGYWRSADAAFGDRPVRHLCANLCGPNKLPTRRE